jgi:hypothetical protein
MPKHVTNFVNTESRVFVVGWRMIDTARVVNSSLSERAMLPSLHMSSVMARLR